MRSAEGRQEEHECCHISHVSLTMGTRCMVMQVVYNVFDGTTIRICTHKARSRCEATSPSSRQTEDGIPLCNRANIQHTATCLTQCCPFLACPRSVTAALTKAEKRTASPHMRLSSLCQVLVLAPLTSSQASCGAAVAGYVPPPYRPSPHSPAPFLMQAPRAPGGASRCAWLQPPRPPLPALDRCSLVCVWGGIGRLARQAPLLACLSGRAWPNDGGSPRYALHA